MKPVVCYEKKRIAFSEEVNWPEGAFDEIIAELQGYKEDFKHVEGAKLEAVWHGYEDCYYYIKGFVMETDEQLAYRVELEEHALKCYMRKEDRKNAKKNAKAKEKLEKEREEYERLKVKFGGA